ncbi:MULTISPECIES: hypothetical protein [unclassified Luteimonas]
MRALRRATLLALLPLAACVGPTRDIPVDASRLVPAARHDPGCSYRLASLVDARQAGAEAGGLHGQRFALEDPLPLVRASLARAGISAGDAARARAVDVELLRLYIARNLGSKVPVVVYRTRMAGESIIVRSQLPSMNWNGTEDEAYAALARALEDANARLAQALGERCGTPDA